MEHVKQYEDLILVTIPRTDTTPQGTFTITGTYFNIVQKYANLRYKNPVSNRFFLAYNDGKCTAQPIGKNKFSGMPRRVAQYLKLPEPGRYSGIQTQNSQRKIDEIFILSSVELQPHSPSEEIHPICMPVLGIRSLPPSRLQIVSNWIRKQDSSKKQPHSTSHCRLFLLLSRLFSEARPDPRVKTPMAKKPVRKSIYKVVSSRLTTNY